MKYMTSPTHGPQDTLLSVKNLAVKFESQEVLSDVSFLLKRGEALAVIGPNGAGKTTLFRALLGLAPSSGQIEWQKGIKISYVPQKLAVEKTAPITVKEFFLLKAEQFFLPKKSFVEHLDHELSLVGLGKETLVKTLGELSAGQFQRMLVSWAMINHPDVLLFDEPTAGIDIGFTETIYNLMHRLQKERGTTILLISHDLNIVYRYAGKVLCINKQPICYGSPREVLKPDDLARLYGEGGFYQHPG